MDPGWPDLPDHEGTQGAYGLVLWGWGRVTLLLLFLMNQGVLGLGHPSAGSLPQFLPPLELPSSRVGSWENMASVFGFLKSLSKEPTKAARG